MALRRMLPPGPMRFPLLLSSSPYVFQSKLISKPLPFVPAATFPMKSFSGLLMLNPLFSLMYDNKLPTIKLPVASYP
eukprot:CAMPEP_0201650190 /NCGR_PEP_ID=MMETSP0493-20130528/40767_1 /ASSEMBLY_ACC=CAM_ASM_000838 /TAXON_ID=420259 /ORGANISM="Thalassiosira gravida, Strain GMp14c1" /LENGTH=76 /DNA_ID=CAMNT_0048126227 /DNA_START=14 /DNA_END=240 /DNA_ORIENTATION=+